MDLPVLVGWHLGCGIIGVPCAGSGVGLNPDGPLPAQEILGFYDSIPTAFPPLHQENHFPFFCLSSGARGWCCLSLDTSSGLV